MKKYPLILAIAALLMGCGEDTDIGYVEYEGPDVSNTPVVITEQKSGTFTVDAKSNPGATFRNGAPSEGSFEFEAKGEWSFAAAAGMLGPGGADALAGENFTLPGARSFAIVAKRDDGKVEFVGDRYTTSLKPQESISFCMNEVSGSFEDNRGSLSVQWTKK